MIAAMTRTLLIVVMMMMMAAISRDFRLKHVLPAKHHTHTHTQANELCTKAGCDIWRVLSGATQMLHTMRQERTNELLLYRRRLCVVD